MLLSLRKNTQKTEEGRRKKIKEEGKKNEKKSVASLRVAAYAERKREKTIFFKNILIHFKPTKSI